jgi:hypothetical protein
VNPDLKPWTHPYVAAEYDRMVDSDPKTCWYPFGAVHRTAQRPRANWCARPVGHEGIHMTAAALDVHRARGASRKRHSRKTS